MLTNHTLSRLLFWPSVLAGALFITVIPVRSQTVEKNQLAKTTVVASKAETVPQPSFNDYRGIKIGMSVDEVRNHLDHLRDKGKDQDFFVFSDTETAQVFYDKAGIVMGVSVDYRGNASNPPTPREVLGEDLQPKPDGSMYDLKRYPAAGYWVAYNRTAGADPTVTVTMQKAQ